MSYLLWSVSISTEESSYKSLQLTNDEVLEAEETKEDGIIMISIFATFWYNNLVSISWNKDIFSIFW